MNKTILTAIFLAGCSPIPSSDSDDSIVDANGTVMIKADIWTDNWFALYLDEKLIHEDSVPITTERSFNAESFEFEADYPIKLNFIFKDFKENDSGLEYIGARNQQMGDGGFSARFFDSSTNRLIAYSDSNWKCLVIHEAPLDKACESESDPVAGEGACDFLAIEEPPGWKSPKFDDSS